MTPAQAEIVRRALAAHYAAYASIRSKSDQERQAMAKIREARVAFDQLIKSSEEGARELARAMVERS